LPILYGAVAYREDVLREFEAEIAAWDFKRAYPHPIPCPKGGACYKTYRLLVPADVSEVIAEEYVDMVLQAMENEPCENHPPFIRINPPVSVR
jgi:hypothetical protein